jgi:hypothetical protein
MQISAANLLLAGQQVHAAQRPVEPQAAAKARPATEFESLIFKQTASPARPAASVATARPDTPARSPGSQLDIRV